MKNGTKAVVFLTTLFFLGAPFAFAADDSDYDPYDTTLRRSEARDPGLAEERDKNLFRARLLEQPLRPVGHSIGKTVEWVERKHVPDKVIWVVDELHLHGIHPGIRTPNESGLLAAGPGGRILVDQLFGVEHAFLPEVEVSGGWTPNREFAGTTVDFGGHYKIQPPASSAFHEGNFSYWRSSSESFYGIGQDTSKGEWSGYQPEEVQLEGVLGYDMTQDMKGKAAFVYQHMNIGNGNRERIGKIKEHFNRARRPQAAEVPGIEGGALIGFAASLKDDTRDFKDDPKHGGARALEFSYFKDVDGSDLQYLKFSGSVSHFFTLLSDRRVLALRLRAEKNQELGGNEVPFFNMSRLGGSDYTRGSELLRSYRFNRFFDESVVLANVEYRYSIYEYGDFAGDAVGLFDIGEVFDEIGHFGFDELKFSYGGGVNVKFRRNTLLSLVAARGNEGWEFATRTKVAF